MMNQELRKKGMFVRVLLICLALTGGYYADSFSQDAETVTLITLKEAAMKEAPLEKFIKIIPKGVTPGPDIIIRSPENGKAYKQPLVIDISFVPKGVPVSIDSFRVVYVKFFEIDITERVKEYIQKKGIVVPKADIPKGKHTLKIFLSDEKGNVTSKKLTFNVL